MQRARRIQGAACWLAALAVILGAFGAHALEGRLDERAKEWYATASQYHFWHAVALWIAGDAVRTGRWGRVSAALFLIGILLFCGSLYAMALTGETWLGAITPIGGLCFIAGWSLLAWAVLGEKGPRTGDAS